MRPERALALLALAPALAAAQTPAQPAAPAPVVFPRSVEMRVVDGALEAAFKLDLDAKAADALRRRFFKGEVDAGQRDAFLRFLEYEAVGHFTARLAGPAGPGDPLDLVSEAGAVIVDPLETGKPLRVEAKRVVQWTAPMPVRLLLRDDGDAGTTLPVAVRTTAKLQVACDGGTPDGRTLRCPLPAKHDVALVVQPR
jgi:hypothetical protein